jgi:hypothetical protein
MGRPAYLTSVNDFGNHTVVFIGFFQFCSADPDVPISRNVLTSFVKNLQSKPNTDMSHALPRHVT